MNTKEYEKILHDLSESISEGIHIVDSKGITILYSNTMADLERQDPKDVVGRAFREVFSNIPLSESTLNKALTQGRGTGEKHQSYLNNKGQEITTINKTKPVFLEGKVIGAIEIAENITKIKSLSDTVESLRGRSIPQTKKNQGRGLSHDNGAGQIKKYVFEDLIGADQEFQHQKEIAKKAANNDGAVFIYGETGTGKELFAQSIHYHGNRRKKPFLAQNCAALPSALLEGILFGTARGGFTGAEDRPGLFEQASGGTLLLDEISAMPYDLQSKLLRVLQEGYVRRVGGTVDIPIDTRIIATVNEYPRALIAQGLLRKDLYYRLNVISINIPPLRDRLRDIPMLAAGLLKKQCQLAGLENKGLTENAVTKLLSYDYPGNVRELENILAAAIFMADEDRFLDEDDIHINYLDINEAKDKKNKEEEFTLGEKGLDEYLKNLERDILERALKEAEGNISRAAEMLQIRRQTLQHKIKKYGL